ncbi:MAG TPA: DUF4249 family protein [Balneolaceae bacterium]
MTDQLIFLAGCDIYNYKQDGYRELYVVETYLIANRPLPFIRLSTTSPINREYKLSEQYVKNARVEVRLLKADSSIAERYLYYGSGTYHPVDTTVKVRANRSYQLYITLQNGDIIEAKTRVPGDFKTVNEVDGNYVYQGEQQIEVTMTPSFYPGRQAFYIFTVNAVEPDSANLTPFYAELVIEQGNLAKSYFINSSGIINEKSLMRNDDETLTLLIPWLSVAFYGENKIIINAIDDNIYDFLRSQNVQTSGLQFITGEIRNANYNINGGIGIFGSMNSDTNTVFIKKRLKD